MRPPMMRDRPLLSRDALRGSVVAALLLAHVVMAADSGPRPTSPTLSTNGVIRFLILGGIWGQTNVVEVSTDLVN